MMSFPNQLVENKNIFKISKILARQEDCISVLALQEKSKFSYPKLIQTLNYMHKRDLLNIYNPSENRSKVKMKKQGREIEFCPFCNSILEKYPFEEELRKKNTEKTYFCEECEAEFEIHDPGTKVIH